MIYFVVAFAAAAVVVVVALNSRLNRLSSLVEAQAEYINQLRDQKPSQEMEEYRRNLDRAYEKFLSAQEEAFEKKLAQAHTKVLEHAALKYNDAVANIKFTTQRFKKEVEKKRRTAKPENPQMYRSLDDGDENQKEGPNDALFPDRDPKKKGSGNQ